MNKEYKKYLSKPRIAFGKTLKHKSFEEWKEERKSVKETFNLLKKIKI